MFSTRRIRSSTSILIFASILFGCGGESEPSVNGALPVSGAELLKPFKMELMQALKSSLESGGPIEAMNVCNVQAPQIADLNSADGVRIGRSSHRLRNISNAPNDWVGLILDDYVTDPASREPQTIELEGGRIGYIEPISLQPMCLQCHGSEIAEDVRAKLASMYPDDAATGFAAGEFRGVFWVEYDSR